MHQGLKSLQSIYLSKLKRSHVPKLLKWDRKSTWVCSSHWPGWEGDSLPLSRKIPRLQFSVHICIFLQALINAKSHFLGWFRLLSKRISWCIDSSMHFQFFINKKNWPHSEISLTPSKWNLREASASWCMGVSEQWQPSLAQEFQNVFNYGASVSDPFISVTKIPPKNSLKGSMISRFQKKKKMNSKVS